MIDYIEREAIKRKRFITSFINSSNFCASRLMLIVCNVFFPLTGTQVFFCCLPGSKTVFLQLLAYIKNFVFVRNKV